MMLATLLKSAAPGLATMVAGPMGGMAVKMIAEKLGVPATEQAVADHLSMNPEQMVKLQEIDLEKIKAAHANTADARAMQVAAMSSGDKFVARFVPILSAFWSIVATVYIFAVTFMTIPVANQRFADTVLGFMLATVVATILNFFLGSSDGSKKKDKS
jgi:hypothetical protein